MVKLKKFYNSNSKTYRLSLSGLSYEHLVALEDLLHMVNTPSDVVDVSLCGVNIPYQRVTSLMRCKRLKSGLFSTNNSLLRDFQKAFDVAPLCLVSSKEVIINPHTNKPFNFNSYE